MRARIDELPSSKQPWQGPECPPDDVVALYLDGDQPADERARLRVHFRECAMCRALFVEAARIVEEPPAEAGAPTAALPPVTQRAGRYELFGLLGMGAMGVVYAAFDPELGRKLAVKILRPHTAELRHDLHRQRFIREAKSLARVVHPNVVAVYDVGQLDGQVFIAMEVVDGGTLRDWLRDGSHTLDETLLLFEEIGRGLGAVHKAGLVHRDFKPENVLIGSDGRPRVTDFGLALADWEERPAFPVSTDAAASPSSLTQTGTVLGTPAYMAPEQLRADAVDSRADIFAYAVALYEAAFSMRPFAGASVAELEAAIRSGQLRLPAARLDRRQRRLLTILRRALQPRAEDRYPSIDELLAQLAALRSPKRGWMRIAGAALLAVVVTAAVAVPVASRQREAARCAQSAFAMQWNAARRDRLAGQLAGQSLGSQVVARLGNYATALERERREVCEATYVRHDESEPQFEARAECLTRLARELELTVDGFVADPTYARPLEVVAGLRSPASCRSVRPRGQRRQPDEKAAYDRLSQRLAAANAAAAFGRKNEAVGYYREAAEAAVASHEKALEAWANIGGGQTLYQLGKLSEAERMLDRGILIAFAADDNGLAVSAYLILIQIEMARGRDAGLVERYGDLARYAAGRGGLDKTSLAQLHRILGDALYNANRFIEAEIEERAAMALDTDVDMIPVYELALGNIAESREDIPAATRLLEHARQTLLPRPDAMTMVAGIDHTLSLIDYRQGEYERALRRVKEAGARIAHLRREQPSIVIENLEYQARFASALKRYVEANGYARECDALAVETLEPDDVLRVDARRRLASTELELGHAARAVELLRTLLNAADQPMRMEGITRARVHLELAEASLALGTAAARAEACRHVAEAAALGKTITPQPGSAWLSERIHSLLLTCHR